MFLGRNLVRLRFLQSIRGCATGKQLKPDYRSQDEIFEQLQNHIRYSSIVEDSALKLGYRKNKIVENRLRKEERKRIAESIKSQPFSVALAHLYGENLVEAKDFEDTEMEPDPSLDYVPYEKLVRQVPKARLEDSSAVVEAPTTGEWMSDYEFYEEDEEDDRSSFYGTPDPKEPVSTIPCGGCGALLQCKEPSIPGYLPSELFKGKQKQQLIKSICQRCHFLKNYNTAINVTVSPEDYVEMISSIRDKKALVILMIDLLDFPCSIWPGLAEILGPKRSVIVVGNKVDLLPKDCPGYLDNIRIHLTKTLEKAGFERNNIKHVSLISATTGFGVEELITKLHNVWGTRGDVYLVGCTNVGKSSLFNALLGSDLCKVQALDLVQRATACPWPGTTLRMLKFPILRPSDYRMFLRTKRLQSERLKIHAENKLRRQQARETGSPKFATLIGHIGKTFIPERTELTDGFSVSQRGSAQSPILTLNENSEVYKNSKWCYDTPGVIQPDQITNLLTTDELLLTIPRQMIRPRTYLLKTGLTLFLAGLGRLDYLEGPQSTRVQLYASPNLPTLICDTTHAEQIYQNLLGTEYLRVPCSDPERLAKWPQLEPASDILLNSCNEKHISVADVVLSSAGWIGITLPPGAEGLFRAWTPERRGIYVRQPSLLPYGLSLRGKRIRGSLAYRVGNVLTKQ
ncbi:nitric oxide-associated protein 1 [Uranotaenia lowii]|uniref:nitric oxide-associated protein 1 n=1 Tax=Uranotaenia lowii TaxID=190385 RepID=UPI00247A0AE1|nr:nitric oxide-associated protein 1 [Uranotaenia lowii]